MKIEDLSKRELVSFIINNTPEKLLHKDDIGCGMCDKGAENAKYYITCDDCRNLDFW